MIERDVGVTHFQLSFAERFDILTFLTNCRSHQTVEATELPNHRTIIMSSFIGSFFERADEVQIIGIPIEKVFLKVEPPTHEWAGLQIDRFDVRGLMDPSLLASLPVSTFLSRKRKKRTDQSDSLSKLDGIRFEHFDFTRGLDDKVKGQEPPPPSENQPENKTDIEMVDHPKQEEQITHAQRPRSELLTFVSFPSSFVKGISSYPLASLPDLSDLPVLQPTSNQQGGTLYHG